MARRSRGPRPPVGTRESGRGRGHRRARAGPAATGSPTRKIRASSFRSCEQRVDRLDQSPRAAGARRARYRSGGPDRRTLRSGSRRNGPTPPGRPFAETAPVFGRFRAETRGSTGPAPACPPPVPGASALDVVVVRRLQPQCSRRSSRFVVADRGPEEDRHVAPALRSGRRRAVHLPRRVRTPSSSHGGLDVNPIPSERRPDPGLDPVDRALPAPDASDPSVRWPETGQPLSLAAARPGDLLRVREIFFGIVRDRCQRLGLDGGDVVECTEVKPDTIHLRHRKQGPISVDRRFARFVLVRRIRRPDSRSERRARRTGRKRPGSSMDPLLAGRGKRRPGAARGRRRRERGA